MKAAIRALVCASAVLVPFAGLAAPASAATTVVFDCEAKPPLVGNKYLKLNQDADVTAPATVAPGAALDIVIDPAPNTVPAEVSGYQVKNIKDFSLKIPIPANSTWVGADLAGGSGIGSTPPKITVSGSVATLSFPGPIAGGSTFELPTVTAHLTAGSAGTIETKLGGSSYSDPGLTFTAVVSAGFDVSAPTACFPNPSPTFTTTTIG